MALLKSISPNWSFALSNTPSAGLFPEPSLLLFVGPSVAGIIGLVVDASLNPLSPFPGIAFPLRGSLFLLTFSSFGSVDTFCILSSTKALFFSSTTFLFISSWVAVESCNKFWAEINSDLASSTADFVLSFTPAFSKAACNLFIEFSNSDLFTCFSTFGCAASTGCVDFSSRVGCVVVSCSEKLSEFPTFELLAASFSITPLLVLFEVFKFASWLVLSTVTVVLFSVLSLANAFVPKNAKPAAIKTEAVPTLNFFIP